MNDWHGRLLRSTRGLLQSAPAVLHNSKLSTSVGRVLVFGELRECEGMTRGPWRANELGCKPTMRFMKNEKNAIMTISSCEFTVNAMGKTPTWLHKSQCIYSYKACTKDCNAPSPGENIDTYTPVRQFYDADNYLNSPRGPTLCGPSLW